jgi:putative oxidoreductase
MFRRLLSTTPTWITVPLRLALGIVFIAHGAQLVFGWWNGPGLTKFVAFDPPFHFMRPGWLWMGAAGLAQLIGGVLVLLGLLTRVGAFLLTCVLLTALFGVHLSHGFFMPAGIEFNVALLGITFALLIAGGGQASIDATLANSRGRRW